MTAEQTAAELTTRDVLLQVDRRLTLIEEDLRGIDDKVETLDTRLSTKIEALDLRLNAKIDDKIDGVYAKLEAVQVRLDNRIDGLRHEMVARFDSHLRWILGTMAVLIGLVIAVIKL
jgi:ABC-type phosphate transport system auxiliary subunit